MSNILCKRIKDLVKNYDLSLEKRIIKGASNLTCADEDLRNQVEEILRNSVAEDVRSLGLDSLEVIEESLKATFTAPLVSTASPCRGGIRGLEKAFEVLEQAALNLYLAPWREEYTVVKMYSGILTHCIKPVLSSSQIVKLFGLLGYQPCPGQQDQLLRRRSGFHSASPGHLLQLSCAFFLARCQCQFLLAALGSHGGEAEWELGLVTERRKGLSLQVALDNTRKLLDTDQIAEEVLGECCAGGELELDLDIYTGRGGVVYCDKGGGPRSLSWAANCSSHSPTAALAHSNGFTSPSSSSSSSPNATTIHRAGEPRCVSTLNCQLSKTSPPRLSPPGATRTASAALKHGAPPDEQSQRQVFDKKEDQLCSPMAQASGLSKWEASLPPTPEHFCSCVECGGQCLKHCLNCNSLHKQTCTLLHKCQVNDHTAMPYNTMEENSKTRPLSTQGVPEPGWSAPPPRINDGAATSSFVLCKSPDSVGALHQPMPYHSCCDLACPDPKLVCYTCSVFHSIPCRDVLFCQNNHENDRLGFCQCGAPCSRKPLVLCRYCGTEYCNPCWYRNPLTCSCGQTFDQSSGV